MKERQLTAEDQVFLAVLPISTNEKKVIEAWWKLEEHKVSPTRTQLKKYYLWVGYEILLSLVFFISVLFPESPAMVLVSKIALVCVWVNAACYFLLSTGGMLYVNYLTKNGDEWILFNVYLRKDNLQELVRYFTPVRIAICATHLLLVISLLVAGHVLIATVTAFVLFLIYVVYGWVHRQFIRNVLKEFASHLDATLEAMKRSWIWHRESRIADESEVCK